MYVENTPLIFDYTVNEFIARYWIQRSFRWRRL